MAEPIKETLKKSYTKRRIKPPKMQHQPGIPTQIRDRRKQTATVSAPPSCTGEPDVARHGSELQSTLIIQAASPIRLQVYGDAKSGLDQEDVDEPTLLSGYDAAGSRTQCGKVDRIVGERLIVLGLDFGTSSVKVVVGDPALGHAFAVPFRAAGDVERYLLPSRLHESSGVFSLGHGALIHDDLKLSLLANPDNLILRRRVIAFLALVIRHVRGWLFTDHRDVYESSRLFWKLAIGLPVAHHLDNFLHSTFDDIAYSAWLTSIASTVDVQSVHAAEERHRILKAGQDQITLDEDLEVSVVPEIAAQIYGFVSSRRFDPASQNIYLMVDVGAGSVDSSLFRVRPIRGKMDFEFFTSVVEPHGVMNLHRHRIQWWEEQLAAHPDGSAFAETLAASKFATDRTTPLPESYTSYFNGISVEINNDAHGKLDPDRSFFRYKLLRQVRSESYYRAWSDGFLAQTQLTGIPAFYCGGGIRMEYYSHLQKEMQSMECYNWMKTEARRVELPKNLEAPGLKQSEYDRLTVAYGLSFLDVGKVTKSLPAPRVVSQVGADWRENYVSKDCC